VLSGRLSASSLLLIII